MKNTLMKLFAITLSVSPFMANSENISGRIFFTGQVVESACNFSNINTDGLNSHCYYSNKPEEKRNENLKVNIDNLMKNKEKSYNTERYSMNAIQNQKDKNLYNIRVNYY